MSDATHVATRLTHAPLSNRELVLALAPLFASNYKTFVVDVLACTTTERANSLVEFLRSRRVRSVVGLTNGGESTLQARLI